MALGKGFYLKNALWVLYYNMLEMKYLWNEWQQIEQLGNVQVVLSVTVYSQVPLLSYISHTF